VENSRTRLLGGPRGSLSAPSVPEFPRNAARTKKAWLQIFPITPRRAKFFLFCFSVFSCGAGLTDTPSAAVAAIPVAVFGWNVHRTSVF
jgi:hypothetical protein